MGLYFPLVMSLARCFVGVVYCYMYLQYDLFVYVLFDFEQLDGGDDWSPCAAGIIKDGHFSGFVGVD